jgi:non-ribosomal peptide synthetase component F
LVPATGAQVADLARQTGATPYVVLLAAYRLLLHRYARSDDVVIGVHLSGRSRPEFEYLVGRLVNLVPLRLSLRGTPAFRDVVTGVRDDLLAALEHADYPFGCLVNDLGPQWSEVHPVLVQVGFNMATQDDRYVIAQTELALPVTGQSAHQDLTVHVLPELSGSFRVVLEYAQDLFDEPVARLLLREYMRLLEQAVAEPDAPVARPGQAWETVGDAGDLGLSG